MAHKRAKSLTRKRRREIAKMGQDAMMKDTTPEQRTEFARAAVKIRWERERARKAAEAAEDATPASRLA